MSCLALRVEKQKLSESIDEMKALVRSSHNKAEEVITHAEEELALARLIRRGADRDLVQAQKTIENLSGKLATATENWNALWKSFRSVADCRCGTHRIPRKGERRSSPTRILSM